MVIGSETLAVGTSYLFLSSSPLLLWRNWNERRWNLNLGQTRTTMFSIPGTHVKTRLIFIFLSETKSPLDSAKRKFYVWTHTDTSISLRNSWHFVTPPTLSPVKERLRSYSWWTRWERLPRRLWALYNRFWWKNRLFLQSIFYPNIWICSLNRHQNENLPISNTAVVYWILRQGYSLRFKVGSAAKELR